MQVHDSVHRLARLLLGIAAPRALKGPHYLSRPVEQTAPPSACSPALAYCPSVQRVVWLVLILFLSTACQRGIPTATPLPTTVPSLPTTPTTWPSTWTPVPTLTPVATATRVVVPVEATATTAPPTAQATRTPAPAGSVPDPILVTEGTITLQSYGWQQALVDSAPDDPIYPYPRLDRDKIQPPGPVTYKTITIENTATRLILLPELGGRILRWLDKTSGKEMFYANPVIKPTHWGARGWWLATGGMEWAFPVEEHGYVEWRPWNVQIVRGGDQASVVLSDIDDRTGLVVEVMVSLEAGHSAVILRPRIHNPTDSAQTFQFWLNGMFALSPDNRPSPELRFILPCDTVTVHSTGDGGLPEAGQPMGWPVHDGRDMGRYGNWQGWLGAFAPPVTYMGAYDPSSDMGVVRVWPGRISRGAKIFGHGGLDPGIWTDDGSGYVELWGGLTPTFWDSTSLASGAEVSWEERWYSLNGLGGLSYANDDAALWLSAGENDVQAGVLSTRLIEGQLVLARAGDVIASWPVDLVPGVPFRAQVPVEGTAGTWDLRLVGSDGRPLAAYRLD